MKSLHLINTKKEFQTLTGLNVNTRCILSFNTQFKWLTQASELNPFDSKFFFWIDAGGSRFFDSYDLKLEYPSPPALQKPLNQMGDKFLIQMNMEYYLDLAQADLLPVSYLLDNRSYVLGSMFGGGPKSLQESC